MDNVIDFLEFKKNKEKEQEDEIELLRRELAALIDDMGGIHTVPFLITSLDPEATSSWAPLPLYSYTYHDFDNDGKKD